MSLLVRFFVTVSVLTGLTAAALAQGGYPSEPIKIIVTVAPGGGVDTVTRMVANLTRLKFPQPVIVENRPGAAGNIGAQFVFQARPDGYTLMASSPTQLTVAPLLYKGVDFNPQEFEPIAVMAHIPNVLLVRPGLPVHSVKELVDYLKANPGKLTVASQGVGTASHLAAELFMHDTGTKLIHVPYNGTAPLLNDIIGGHVDITFIQVANAAPLDRAGKAHILAVATKERLENLPGVPTMEEAGFPGEESETWNAIAAPPRTPAAIVQKLNTAINEALKDPALREKFSKMDMLPGGGSLDEVRQFINTEKHRWTNVIKDAGIEAGGNR